MHLFLFYRSIIKDSEYFKKIDRLILTASHAVGAILSFAPV